MTSPEVNSLPAHQPAPRRRFERALLAFVLLSVGWFDVWTLKSTGHVWNFGAEQNDYYNLLIDGWLAGQLHMKVDVPAALVRLRDPYDPNQRPPGVGLHDASYYRGKYYLYFGAAPLVVLMLPFRVITGIDLPVAFAVLVFVYGGFLASAGLWLEVRRRWFPGTRSGTAVLGVAVLGLASLAPVLLRRPQMWELPIAAGYCFAMLALWCVARSLWREQDADETHGRRGCATVWLGAGGLCLGLAIASRPPYLFATPILALPLLVWWREERCVRWRSALAAVAPLIVIGAVMALHNYARFENPFEFGQAYQLTYFDERSVAHFSLRYAGFNGWRYFFSPAQWSRYFPFVAPPELPSKPPGFSGHDDLYGVLVNLPFGWFALFAPLALRKRMPAERARLGAWLSTVGLLFAVMAGLLLCFFGSLARYEVDFTPALMLLAGVGVLALERTCAGAAPFLRRSVRMAWTAAAGFSMAFVVLFTLQYDAQLQRHNPVEAAAVARVLNWGPYLFERAMGVKHGGLELELTLRPEASGDQLLVTMGEPPRMVRVLARQVDAARVQFVVAPAEGPAIASRAVAFDFARAHTLRLTLGSLLPPETHPFFRGRSPSEIDELTRRVQVELDGETIIDERRELAGGAQKIRASAGVAISRRIETAPALPPDLFVRLRLAFPSKVSALREPLIGFRDAGASGVLFVHYIDDAGQLAFGASVGGERVAEGDRITVDPARVHELVIRGWSGRDSAQQRIELRLDETIAWSRAMPSPTAQGTLMNGRNITAEPACADGFSGRIHSVQRAADGRDPLLTSGDVVKLRVMFPSGRHEGREPLVVTGCTGAGDLLMVEYVDAHTIRFAIDHWGGPMLVSDPVPVDFAVPHEIVLATTALRGATADIPLRMARKGAIRVGLDGAVVWRAPALTFAARPDELAVGFNPIGGTSCSARFSGDILSAERLAR